jgi:hypothetical protein
VHAKRAFGLVSAGILIVLTACGDDDDHGEAISAFTQQYCDLHEGFCCTQQGKTFDQGSCNLLLSFAASSSFDQAAADACIAGLKAAQSSPTFCSDHGGAAVNDKCNAVYPATGGGSPPGGTCETSRDCAPVQNGEVSCLFSSSNGTTTHTCQAQLRGTAGADCQGDRSANSSFGVANSKDATVTICWEADSLYCDATTKKCTAPAALGGKCSPSENLSCAKDAYCARPDTSSSSTDYICKAKSKADEACDLYSRTSCVDGFHCDSSKKTCQPDTPVGGACNPSAPTCGPTAQCTNGTCAVAATGFSLFCK